MAKLVYGVEIRVIVMIGRDQICGMDCGKAKMLSLAAVECFKNVCAFRT